MAYGYRSAGLGGARLVKTLSGCVTPFCGFFRRLLVLLEPRDVLFAEVEAVS